MEISSEEELIESLVQARANREDEDTSWVKDLVQLPDLPEGDQRQAIMIPVHGSLHGISIDEEGEEAVPVEERPAEAEGAEEEISEGDIQAEAQSFADERVSEAQGIEAELTSTVTGLAEQFGGEAIGLEFAVKLPESLARKIRIDMIEKGISAEEATAAISDVNRYTMLFDNDIYVDQVLEVQGALLEQGWEQYDHKWKNYFRAGDAYDGYNTVMVNPDTGQRFELQFHTPESKEVMNEVHLMYEEFRVLPDDQTQRAKELQTKMRESWGDYQKPEGWERLPGVLK